MTKPCLQFHMKLRIFYQDKNFGPGVCGLMRLVRETHSLSAACQRMQMSYSKAWKLVKRAENDLGIALFTGSRGGKNGGNTVLTKAGEEFLDRYLIFSKEAEAAVAELFQKYYG